MLESGFSKNIYPLGSGVSESAVGLIITRPSQIIYTKLRTTQKGRARVDLMFLLYSPVHVRKKDHLFEIKNTYIFIYVYIVLYSLQIAYSFWDKRYVS